MNPIPKIILPDGESLSSRRSSDSVNDQAREQQTRAAASMLSVNPAEARRERGNRIAALHLNTQASSSDIEMSDRLSVHSGSPRSPQHHRRNSDASSIVSSFSVISRVSVSDAFLANAAHGLMAADADVLPGLAHELVRQAVEEYVEARSVHEGLSPSSDELQDEASIPASPHSYEHSMIISEADTDILREVQARAVQLLAKYKTMNSKVLQAIDSQRAQEGQMEWPSYRGDLQANGGKLYRPATSDEDAIFNHILALAHLDPDLQGAIVGNLNVLQDIMSDKGLEGVVTMHADMDTCYRQIMDRSEMKSVFVREHAKSRKLVETSVMRDTDSGPQGIHCLLALFQKIENEAERGLGNKAGKITLSDGEKLPLYDALALPPRISFRAKPNSGIGDAEKESLRDLENEVNYALSRVQNHPTHGAAAKKFCAGVNMRCMEKQFTQTNADMFAWFLDALVNPTIMGIVFQLVVANSLSRKIFEPQLKEAGSWDNISGAKKYLLDGGVTSDMVSQGDFLKQKVPYTLVQEVPAIPVEWNSQLTVGWTLKRIDEVKAKMAQESGRSPDDISTAAARVEIVREESGKLKAYLASVGDTLKSWGSHASENWSDALKGALIGFVAGLPDKLVETRPIHGAADWLGQYFIKVATGMLGIFGASAGFFTNQKDAPWMARQAVIALHDSGILAWPDEIKVHLDTLRSTPGNIDAAKAVDRYLRPFVNTILQKNPENKIPRQATALSMYFTLVFAAVATGTAAVGSALFGNLFQLYVLNPWEVHSMAVLSAITNKLGQKGFPEELAEFTGLVMKEHAEGRLSLEQAQELTGTFAQLWQPKQSKARNFGKASMNHLTSLGSVTIDTTNRAAGIASEGVRSIARPSLDGAMWLGGQAVNAVSSGATMALGEQRRQQLDQQLEERAKKYWGNAKALGSALADFHDRQLLKVVRRQPILEFIHAIEKLGPNALIGAGSFVFEALTPSEHDTRWSQISTDLIAGIPVEDLRRIANSGEDFEHFPEPDPTMLKQLGKFVHDQWQGMMTSSIRMRRSSSVVGPQPQIPASPHAGHTYEMDQLSTNSA